MSRKQKTAWRRTVSAYDVMRGRPSKPDYGFLAVLVLVASAGGALIGVCVDLAVTRRAAAAEPPRHGGLNLATSPGPLSSSGRRDA